MKRFKVWALSAVATVMGPTLTLVAAPRAAVAQFTNMYTGGMWNNPTSSLADTAILNNVFERMLTPDEASSSGATYDDLSASPVAATYDLSASAFSPIAASLIPQQWAVEQATNPTEQQELDQLYSELLLSYSDLLVENGEERLQNNVAGAMVYLMLTSSYVLTDGEELSEAVQEELLQGFNVGLAESPEFQALSAEDKQALYETVVISGGLALSMYLQGYELGDAELVQQGQDMAQFILTDIVGLPLDQAAASEAKSASIASLVGEWQDPSYAYIGFYNIDAYDAASGVWFGGEHPDVFQTGTGIRFTDDGRYVWNVYATIGNGGCRTRAADYQAGTATVEGNLVTLVPSVHRQFYEGGCSSNLNGDRDLPLTPQTWQWSIGSDSQGNPLLQLVASDGDRREYSLRP